VTIRSVAGRDDDAPSWMGCTLTNQAIMGGIWRELILLHQWHAGPGNNIEVASGWSGCSPC